MRHDLVLAGVGGQGILTIARVLSLAAEAKGLHVKQAEVHGMSQRGGAVYSHLRISDGEIYSDLIPRGRADMVLAVEPVEALRYVPMLRPDGAVVSNSKALTNIPNYPSIEDVLAHIGAFERHVAFDMDRLGRAAGSPLAANIAALGAASLFLGFSAHELEEAVVALFTAKAPRVVETNVRAFRFGRLAATRYTEALQRGATPRVAREWIESMPPEDLESPEAEVPTAEDATRLTGAEAHAFENLLQEAYEEERAQLYEHEVYNLIELVGAISPPRHTFVPRGSTIDPDVLAQYPGDRVVVKLVSQDVVHKTEAEAVAFVAKHPDAVDETIKRLLAKVGESARVAGTLVVEFVEHDTRGLGGELFVGIRASREFGPVIAAGLGGQDTEYLATKMRPGVAVAKAVAMDTDAETFLEMFRATAAYDVLAGNVRGHERVVSDAELLRCFQVFLSIARRFCVDRGEEGPDLAELEVNPFAFRNQRLVPLDGRGRLGTAPVAAPVRPADQVACLLKPGSIALTGVSSKPGSFGRILLGNVLAAGFDPEHVTVVKEGVECLDGVRCVPSLDALPGPTDLLVIAAPAAAVPEIVREANGSGKVRSAIIISGGAGETPGSEEIGAELREAICSGRQSGKSGAVFLGPNCMGLRSRPGKVDAFFLPEDKLPRSREGEGRPLALLSQSGAFIAARLSSLHYLEPRVSVSIGNQADVTVSDLLNTLAVGDEVSVAGVYLEGFANLDGLETVRAIARWRAAGKTVVFYKAGRTETGRSAAAGHTAAVAGDYDVCLAALESAGALVAHSFREFGQLLEVAALGAEWNVRGSRFFGITNAGMEAVGMADAHADWTRLDGPFEGVLQETLGRFGLDALVSARNPLDVTPAADEDAYDALVRLTLDREDVDALVVGCVPLAPSLRTLEGQLGDPAAFPARAAQWRALSDKPLVFVVDAGPLYDPLAAALRGQGVPVFRYADEAVAALARWVARAPCLWHGA
ncbi:MAG: indolepyruvate oxidoreductase subunit beta [Fimbriimonadaceae bacterium]|nr:indolepyruvate oxidoreductase subunit beta [Chthonomonadaceae bacterium]MCO5297235.1 indolepyruvate oxidoreductase subunit beta [Fimbriimonadaceae bacterium]